MKFGRTKVVLCQDAAKLGKRSASDVGNKIRELLNKQEKIRMIFAAGESQITFLDALAREKDINWKRIICFNMDDFYDVKIPEIYTCGYQTRRQLYDRVSPGRVYQVRYNAPDPHEEARRFESIMLSEGKFDILCQGIGTSGHLALNEPFDTDFEDKAWVRVVNLAEQSMIQLREDPNFKALGYIPAKGITMTIPALMSAKNVYTMVPLALKRPILEKLFIMKTPTAELPASILLQVESTLYIDRDSCPEGLISKF
jgi:glucosamine-6-phosphate deaminase